MARRGNNDDRKVVTGLAVGAGLVGAGYLLYNWFSNNKNNGNNGNGNNAVALRADHEGNCLTKCKWRLF